jgi:hypothetical protein
MRHDRKASTITGQIMLSVLRYVNDGNNLRAISLSLQCGKKSWCKVIRHRRGSAQSASLDEVRRIILAGRNAASVGRNQQ